MTTTTPDGWTDPNGPRPPERRGWFKPWMFALGVLFLAAASSVLSAYVSNATRTAVNRDASVVPITARIGDYEYPCLRFTDNAGGARGGLWCDETRARKVVLPVPTPLPTD